MSEMFLLFPCAIPFPVKHYDSPPQAKERSWAGGGEEVKAQGSRTRRLLRTTSGLVTHTHDIVQDKIISVLQVCV